MTETLPNAAPLAQVTVHAAPVRVQLRIIATTDLHMHLSGHDYHADKPCALKGLCLTASLIAQARREVPGSVLLDNGDFLQGSPLGDFVVRSNLRPHPMIHAMGHLQYDAVNLGNHEFSHGMATLNDALSEASFPVVSANTVAKTGTLLAQILRPWSIVERHLTDAQGRQHQVRIGVIGVLPPETEIWDRQAIDGQVTMQPMTQTIARFVPDMRKAGADVIVVLAHCGLGSAPDQSGPTDGAVAIAQTEGVDAIVMGHVHMVFPGPMTAEVPGVDVQAATLHGTPAVMPGFFGSHLGVIDLSLEQTAAGWQVAAHQVAVRPIASRDAEGRPVALVPPDPSLTALIQPVHDRTRDWARKPVGRSSHAIHSFFAMVTDCPSVQIVNQAQAAYVAHRLADSAFAHLPVLSATAPFKAGGLGGPENYTFIPPGDILLRHAADLYIHPNTVVALRITGAGLRSWLECSARGYRQISQGDTDQPLFGLDLPSFVYDTISGLTYEIDLAAPLADRGGQRIHNLCWQGKPLDPNQEFILATNSYRGSGNGGYTPPNAAEMILDEQTANRDILIAHMERMLARSGSLTIPQQPGWRFRPMPGTSVVFDTSPLAGPFLTNHPHLALTPLFRTSDGFLRVRLSL